MFSRGRRSTGKQEEPASEAKPFKIPKREVWEAFKRVRANQGAAGVDGQSIAEFEADLRNNLYMLWNRLSSGSCTFLRRCGGSIFRKRMAVRGRWAFPLSPIELPRKSPGRRLEPILEPVFHGDYGYRPGRAAIDAVRTARQRCWRYDWVLDL